MQELTLAQAEEITGVAPRKVRYCLWNDAEKTRDACAWYHVVECENDEEAKRRAVEYYTKGREVVHKPECLYTHLQYQYYQREGVFVPTVFTFISTKMPASWKARYGNFVTRWSLVKQNTLSDIRGKLNCNFYSIYELDSEKDTNHIHLCSNVERLWSKYPPHIEKEATCER